MALRKEIGQKQWNNQSVTTISMTGNPLEDIQNKAREVVFSAMQKGWSGPPFDPFGLADILKITVIASEDVLDARMIPTRGGKLTIEYNPNRPKARIRYSIAHEIAHTLFPDCAQRVRERHRREEMKQGDWKVEMLCNIGAAEFLMPIGSFPDLAKKSINIDILMDLRKQYEVSVEAVLLRVVKLTEERCVVFCSSRRESHGRSAYYHVDYMVPSRTNTKALPFGSKLPSGSVVEECTVVGYTAKGDEEWPHNLGRVHVESVALPPYPAQPYPRVAGLALLRRREKVSINRIKYLKGDATEPRGKEKKIIAFIINDKGRSWGAGFARALQKKWPFVLEEFQYWLEHNRSEFSLGNVHASKVEEDLAVFKMIAQHGYGEAPIPRIRYGALEACLRKLSNEAVRQKTSVHMPRIGCGQAGGSWWIVSELIDDILVKRGIKVTVYDLPTGEKRKGEKQMSFVRQ